MKLLKKIIKKIPYVNLIASKIYGGFVFSNSKSYWEKRYFKNGNSGSGSYGRLSIFKAKIINEFINEKKIKDIIEFGCGDGNQANLLKVKKYIGLDVSTTIIKKCINKFNKDESKSFFIYDSFCFFDNLKIFSADLTISLDVIYHLVETNIFEKYMSDLFNYSKKYVIIYSSNFDSTQISHVKHRKFANWIKKNISNFKLVTKIENKYKFNKLDPNNTSLADFYIYEKIN